VLKGVSDVLDYLVSDRAEISNKREGDGFSFSGVI